MSRRRALIYYSDLLDGLFGPGKSRASGSRERTDHGMLGTIRHHVPTRRLPGGRPCLTALKKMVPGNAKLDESVVPCGCALVTRWMG